MRKSYEETVAAIEVAEVVDMDHARDSASDVERLAAISAVWDAAPFLYNVAVDDMMPRFQQWYTAHAAKRQRINETSKRDQAYRGKLLADMAAAKHIA